MCRVLILVDKYLSVRKLFLCQRFIYLCLLRVTADVASSTPETAISAAQRLKSAESPVLGAGFWLPPVSSAITYGENPLVVTVTFPFSTVALYVS